jgi:NADH-quinone oxidoreductase subunit N
VLSLVVTNISLIIISGNIIGEIVLLSLLGTILIISSNHLLTIILALELQSFISYILVAMSNLNNKKNEESTSAGLKYLLLGAMASAIMILSISLIYISTGLIDYNSLLQ